MSARAGPSFSLDEGPSASHSAHRDPVWPLQQAHLQPRQSTEAPLQPVQRLSLLDIFTGPADPDRRLIAAQFEASVAQLTLNQFASAGEFRRRLPLDPVQAKSGVIPDERLS